jgi:hypothetical protein
MIVVMIIVIMKIIMIVVMIITMIITITTMKKIIRGRTLEISVSPLQDNLTRYNIQFIFIHVS